MKQWIFTKFSIWKPTWKIFDTVIKPTEVSVRKGVLRNFTNFRKTPVSESLFLIKLQAWDWKFLRAPFLTEHLRWMLLTKSIILKLVSAIFYQIFIYHQMIALQKNEKCFLFHLKSSFRSRDFQVFFIFVFPPFSPCQPLL